MGSEYDSAAFPQRAAGGTAASVAGAFLTPGLTAAAANHCASLGGMGAEALAGQLHYDGLMKEGAVHFHAENFVIQFDFANLIVSDIINCYFWHNLANPPSNYFFSAS